MLIPPVSSRSNTQVKRDKLFPACGNCWYPVDLGFPASRIVRPEMLNNERRRKEGNYCAGNKIYFHSLSHNDCSFLISFFNRSSIQSPARRESVTPRLAAMLLSASIKDPGIVAPIKRRLSGAAGLPCFVCFSIAKLSID